MKGGGREIFSSFFEFVSGPGEIFKSLPPCPRLVQDEDIIRSWNHGSGMMKSSSPGRTMAFVSREMGQRSRSGLLLLSVARESVGCSLLPNFLLRLIGSLINEYMNGFVSECRSIFLRGKEKKREIVFILPHQSASVQPPRQVNPS